MTDDPERAAPEAATRRENARRLWLLRTVVLALLCAAAVYLLFFTRSAPPSGPWVETTSAITDAGHMPFFLVGLIGWYWLCPIWRGHWRRRFWMALGLATFGAVGVEIFQPMFGRQASVGDLVNGVLGVIGGTALLLSWRDSGKRRWLWRAAALALTATMGLYVSQPVIAHYRAARWRAANFPVLADFASDVQQPLWRQDRTLEGHTVTPVVSPDEGMLRVFSWGGAQNGVEYLAGDQDWSDYRTLVIHLDVHEAWYTDSALLIRLEDDESRPLRGIPDTRWHWQVAPEEGEAELRLPLVDAATGANTGIPVDLSLVRRLVIFSPGELRDFDLDHVELQR